MLALRQSLPSHRLCRSSHRLRRTRTRIYRSHNAVRHGAPRSGLHARPQQRLASDARARRRFRPDPRERHGRRPQIRQHPHPALLRTARLGRAPRSAPVRDHSLRLLRHHLQRLGHHHRNHRHTARGRLPLRLSRRLRAGADGRRGILPRRDPDTRRPRGPAIRRQ